MEKNIIVPIDFSDISKDVALYADQWAQRTKGKLHFLYVSQMPEMSYYPAHFEQADKFDETEQIARLDAFLTPLDLKADRKSAMNTERLIIKFWIWWKGKSGSGDYGSPFAHDARRAFYGKQHHYVVHHILPALRF